MCGIFGVIDRSESSVERGIAARAIKTLAHRGPDDVGVYGWRRTGEVQLMRNPQDLQPCSVLLLHRRLSILDVSTAGWQPMATPDGRYVITYNGEIYNFIELRAELQAEGYKFHSDCDTEVLLAAYAAWGADMLNRLVGMFAFAIFDTVERRAFLARDFFGIKPLYYSWYRGGLAFASEIKALLDLPGLSRAANPSRLQEYLLTGRTDHGGDTMFAAVRQLPPAHALHFSSDGTDTPEPVCYWNIDPNRVHDVSFRAATEQLRELFIDNVRLHLRSDVPVGAALSGGIDSSAIVAVMRHIEPKLPLHTFTYVAEDPALTEKKWADLVVDATGSNPHQVDAKAHDMRNALDTLIRVQDEPFASTSIYAQYRVFQAAAEAGITVMLDGQGADELLAGYWPYVLARVGSLMRSGQWMKAVTLTRASAQRAHIPQAALLTRAGGMMLPQTLRARLRRDVKARPPLWLNTTWFRERGVPAEAGGTLAPGRDMLRRNLIDTVSRSLPGLLRFEDRNSMASSIESRVPFLTKQFAEFVLALPEEYLLSQDGTTKCVFRAAMDGIVPRPILERKDKIGFATPEANWLLSLREWVEQLMTGEVAAGIPVLSREGMRTEWLNSVRNGKVDVATWRRINLIRWSEINQVQYA